MGLGLDFFIFFFKQKKGRQGHLQAGTELGVAGVGHGLPTQGKQKL
jgi:hypothetical protein